KILARFQPNVTGPAKLPQQRLAHPSQPAPGVENGPHSQFHVSRKGADERRPHPHLPGRTYSRMSIPIVALVIARIETFTGKIRFFQSFPSINTTPPPSGRSLC